MVYGATLDILDIGKLKNRYFDYITLFHKNMPNGGDRHAKFLYRKEQYESLKFLSDTMMDLIDGFVRAEIDSGNVQDSKVFDELVKHRKEVEEKSDFLTLKKAIDRYLSAFAYIMDDIEISWELQDYKMSEEEQRLNYATEVPGTFSSGNKEFNAHSRERDRFYMPRDI